MARGVDMTDGLGLGMRILESVPDAVLAVAADQEAKAPGPLRVVFANMAAGRLLGVAAADLMAATPAGTAALQRIPGLLPRLAAVLADGKPVECVECIVDSHRTLWLRLSIQPYDGGAVATLCDVSRLKEDGEVLSAAACLGEAIDTLDDGFGLFDPGGRLVICNRRFRDILGNGKEPLQPGSTIAGILRSAAEQDMFPAARGRIDQWLSEKIDQFNDDAVPCEIEYKDNRWLRATARKTREGGTVCLWSDVTGVKVAENRIRDALHSTSGGFALWDPADRLVLCNDEYRRVVPKVADRLVAGVSFRQFLQAALEQGQIRLEEENPEAWLARRMASHVAESGEGYFEMQMGDGRWIQASERRTRDGGVVSFQSDITELKKEEIRARMEGEYYRRYMDEIFITRSRLEKQGAALVRLAEDLFQEKEKAEQASLRKTQFLANLSHELRTPMNAILGFAEMLKLELFGPLGSDRYLQYAKDIYDSGQHLLQLINDVLDMSRIEAGRKELVRETIDPRAIADECLRLVYEQAEKQGVVLVNTVPVGSEPLSADRRAVKQCLVNLLSNGIKFTPSGGSVTLSADRLDMWQAIRVRDTGIGIPAEDLPKLANPFVRSLSTANATDDSTGLGLAITRALVEMHGGSLAIDSAPGSGTTVSLLFPRM
ncbi:MAG: PAS-domain containing protein [Magnetospirillum sp. WYHS-4]